MQKKLLRVKSFQISTHQMHGTNTDRATRVEEESKNRENVYRGSKKSHWKDIIEESGMNMRYHLEERSSKSGENEASWDKVEGETEAELHICLNDFKMVQTCVKENTTTQRQKNRVNNPKLIHQKISEIDRQLIKPMKSVDETTYQNDGQEDKLNRQTRKQMISVRKISTPNGGQENKLNR